MKRKLFLVLGICVLTLTGCGKTVPKLENGKEVVASINGYDLTAEDLYEELKAQGGIGVLIDKIDNAIADIEIKDSTDAEKDADDQIEKLKKQYKEVYNVNLEDILPQYGYSSIEDLRNDMIYDYKRSSVLNNYLEKNLTEDEINKYYEDEIFGEMTVRHILIEPEKKDTDEDKKKAEEEAKKKAEELIQKLNEGADFETLAKDNSDDAGTASQGGLLADITKEGVDESFFKASLALENGKYTTTPVKSIFGYHIILKVSQKEKPKLEDVIDVVKEKIIENKLAADTDKVLTVTSWDAIRKEHKISINDSVLNKNYDTVINSYKKENAN